MMASFWHCVLVSCLLVVSSVVADMKLDCRSDHLNLVWTDGTSQTDFSLFRLGSCFPTSFTMKEVIFNVEFGDCSFKKLVTGNELIYTNDLIYTSSPDSNVPPFSLPVVCSFERPKDWYPMIYDPVFSTYGVEDLVFRLALMNDDFSGPAKSTNFPLGSMIPIMASVEQVAHQPLLLLLEECVAATTADLQSGSDLYPIITNKGCLVDSKISRSTFEPREKSSELMLLLQAFRFALGQEVYIHCSLLAWDPLDLDTTKKACHYVKDHGWELLDNPVYSGLCDCCDSTCKTRKTRSLESGKTGLVQKAVLGPLTITDSTL
ncbi:zona pellucida glycoprotein 3f, tandem duplicate 1 [Austrofundulus limnaeus]|uniref:Zona pellucida glycoprotein 3f, tandem duplicate 1 n=1 Tax=Austrofundulus limnaeus TaxID=52670 RepID=A0A2I4AWV2_AUSLI|nr:PREDICTED: zona pellucida sperm-binding protein 3-like [Austrofundulus limnaeus]